MKKPAIEEATWLRYVRTLDRQSGYSPPVEMVFLLNSKPVDALALIVHRSAQESVGRAWVKKLREFTASAVEISH